MDGRGERLNKVAGEVVGVFVIRRGVGGYSKRATQ